MSQHCFYFATCYCILSQITQNMRQCTIISKILEDKIKLRKIQKCKEKYMTLFQVETTNHA